MTLLTESLSLGLDSALCCLALGAAIPSRGTQFILATLFGLCDLAASLLSSLPASHIVAMPPAPLYLGFAFLLGIGARSYRCLAWAAPILLSIDNLYSITNVPDAVTDAAISSLLALTAMRIGAWLRERGIAHWMVHASREKCRSDESPT